MWKYVPLSTLSPPSTSQPNRKQKKEVATIKKSYSPHALPIYTIKITKFYEKPQYIPFFPSSHSFGFTWRIMRIVRKVMAIVTGRLVPCRPNQLEELDKGRWRTVGVRRCFPLSLGMGGPGRGGNRGTESSGLGLLVRRFGMINVRGKVNGRIIFWGGSWNSHMDNHCWFMDLWYEPLQIHISYN